MRISVNCPSYKRPEVKTLKYLPFCKVWVAPEEAEAYRKANPNATIVVCDEGVQGNVARVRNHILDREFADGVDAVVMVDDDMQGCYTFAGTKEYPYKNRLIEPSEFLEWVEKYSEMCEQLGFKEWGMNCNYDARSYHTMRPFSFKSFIGGPFTCFLNNPLRYDESLPLKEDYDMVIQQCNKYRGILCVRFAHYVVKQSVNAGGCAAYRNREREEQQLNALIRKWGSRIVHRDTTNKGHTDKDRVYGDYNPIIKIPIKGI